MSSSQTKDLEPSELEQLRADLEAQQAPADEWLEVKRFIDQSPDEGSNPPVKRYIRHLEAKVAEFEAQQTQVSSGRPIDAELASVLGDTKLFRGMTGNAVMWKYVRHLEAKVAEFDHELRCERIDGGKVRDDLKARIAEMEQHGRKVDQTNHEHYGRLQDQIAIRDLKIEKLEDQLNVATIRPWTVERLREKLAELTTIYNAIPPACPDAQALVQVRIDSVKKEIQYNERKTNHLWHG